MKYYFKTHEWIEETGESTYKIGVSKYAADQLGDIVFVEAKSEGDSFDKGESLAILESVKAVGDIYAPFDCEVSAVNEALEDSPELINQSQDWVVEIKAKAAVDMAAIDAMPEADYTGQYLATL